MVMHTHTLCSVYRKNFLEHFKLITTFFLIEFIQTNCDGDHIAQSMITHKSNVLAVLVGKTHNWIHNDHLNTQKWHQSCSYVALYQRWYREVYTLIADRHRRCRLCLLLTLSCMCASIAIMLKLVSVIKASVRYMIMRKVKILPHLSTWRLFDHRDLLFFPFIVVVEWLFFLSCIAIKFMFSPWKSPWEYFDSEKKKMETSRKNVFARKEAKYLCTENMLTGWMQ